MPVPAGPTPKTMSFCSIASTYLRWLIDRGCTVRFTPADRCLPASASERSVVAGSATTSRSIPFSSPLCGLTPCLRKRLEVLEDALHARHALFRSLHVNGIGPQIDPDAERVFHQPEVFIAGPEQGLKIGRDLQSDLQRIRQPPMWWVWVKVIRSHPPGAAGAAIRSAEKLAPAKIRESTVSGHEFSRAAKATESRWALAPAQCSSCILPGHVPVAATRMTSISANRATRATAADCGWRSTAAPRTRACFRPCRKRLTGFEGSPQPQGTTEPKLWAVWRNRGLALATKSGICA